MIEQYRQFVAVCSSESGRKGLAGLAFVLAAGSRLCVADAKTETRTFLVITFVWVASPPGFAFYCWVSVVAVPGPLRDPGTAARISASSLR